MVSGIANNWSCHYSCNHAFSEFIVGGPLTEERFKRLAIDRSPMMRLDKPTTPTLIIHGSEDRCTPLGQAQEFYAGLVERGVRQRARRLSARGPWAARGRAIAAISGAAPSPGSIAICGRHGGLMQAAAVLRFILRRLAIAIPLLLIVSFGVFALVHLAPGDPVRALLGSRASDPATLAAIREHYHLNDPFIVQYGKWLWQVLQGDLGRSIQGSQLVTSAIRQRLGVTIFLGLDELRHRARLRHPARHAGGVSPRLAPRPRPW